MASTLGATVAAEADGTVTESIAQTSQQSPTPKSDLHRGLATNENTQFMLSRDWIYHSTAVWSTLQERGSIISYIPLHPSECNWFNKHLYEAFNAWVGGMKIRVQPMSTFQYGGSLKIGYLPPDIKPEEFSSLSLQLLSTFPSINIDPKNTDYTCFEGEDQRRVLYHQGTLDYGNQDTFGGYIVLYVMGKLVTSGDAAASTISLVIEAAGNFEFIQPNPRFIQSVQSDDHPLSTYTEEIFNGITCDSHLGSQGTTFQILTSGTQNLNAGYWCSYGVNETRTIDTSSVSGLSVIKRQYGDDMLSGELIPRTAGWLHTYHPDDYAADEVVSWPLNDETNPGAFIYPPNINFRDVHISAFAITNNVEPYGDYSIMAYGMDDVQAHEWPSPHTPVLHTAGGSTQYEGWRLKQLSGWSGEAMSSRNWIFSIQRYNRESFGTTGLPNGPIASTSGILTKRRAGESFVIFSIPEFGTMDIQSQAIGNHIRSFVTHDLNITWVYNVIQYNKVSNERIGTVLTVRLWPEGYFTTSGYSSRFILPTAGFSYKLEYVESLAANSPLPLPTTQNISLIKRFIKGTQSRADQVL